MGFEPTTPTLARLCSTPELHPRLTRVASSGAYMAQGHFDCNRLIGLPAPPFASLPFAAPSAARGQPMRTCGAVVADGRFR